MKAFCKGDVYLLDIERGGHAQTLISIFYPTINYLCNHHPFVFLSYSFPLKTSEEIHEINMRKKLKIK